MRAQWYANGEQLFPCKRREVPVIDQAEAGIKVGLRLKEIFLPLSEAKKSWVQNQRKEHD